MRPAGATPGLRLLLAVLLCVACCAAAAPAGDDMPDWHPHHAHVGAEEAHGFRSRLGCGHLTTPLWIRRFCFSPLVVVKDAQGGHPAQLAYNVSVTSLDCEANDCVKPEGFSAACGDTLRVVFASQRSRLVPDAFSLGEVACGVHSLRLSVAAVGEGELWAELTLLHAGSHPSAVLNAPVRVPGTLRLPPSLVLDEDEELLDDSRAGGPGFMGVKSGEWSPFGESPAPGGRHVPVPPTPANLWCTSASAPGQWVASHALYPPSGGELGEPWVWKPHGCIHPRVTGIRLARCLGKPAEFVEKKGVAVRTVAFQGGAAARQLKEAFWSHLVNETYYWPGSGIAAWNAEPETPSQVEMAQAAFSYTPSERIADAPVPPHASAWIFSYGLADAQAGLSLLQYSEQLEAWLAKLAAARAAGPKPPPAVFWTLAPSVVYKQPGLAGEASCTVLSQAGAAECVGVTLQDHEAARGGEVNWTAVTIESFVPGSALSSRTPLAADVRAFNAVGWSAVKRLLPDAHVFDYEALTEGLHGDYSFDGLRWGCDKGDHDAAEAAGGPYRCRALANSVAANILAATLCAKEIQQM